MSFTPAIPYAAAAAATVAGKEWKYPRSAIVGISVASDAGHQDLLGRRQHTAATHSDMGQKSWYRSGTISIVLAVRDLAVVFSTGSSNFRWASDCAGESLRALGKERRKCRPLLRRKMQSLHKRPRHQGAACGHGQAEFRFVTVDDPGNDSRRVARRYIAHLLHTDRQNMIAAAGSDLQVGVFER